MGSERTSGPGAPDLLPATPAAWRRQAPVLPPRGAPGAPPRRRGPGGMPHG